MTRWIASLAAAAALAFGLTGPSLAQDLPAAEVRAQDPFEPLYRLIGRTWRGQAVGQEGVEDVVRWEWAVGGHAVRAVHAVNGGVYGGETLIFPDRDSGELIFHYFTSGGFHTTGVIRPTGPGVFEIEETVHGVEGLERLRSTMTLTDDGTYRTRSLAERDGQWIEFGGFDYRIDNRAEAPAPERAGEQASVEAGGLRLSRRIVADPGEAGHDVAAYLRVDGAGADRLIGATCVCAERVELHRIDRSGDSPDMVTDLEWIVPEGGRLDVRPGSDLHLMLIGFDPARAEDGPVTLTLTFAQAGAVEVSFDLATDSRSAWARFD